MTKNMEKMEAVLIEAGYDVKRGMVYGTEALMVEEPLSDPNHPDYVTVESMVEEEVDFDFDVFVEPDAIWVVC